MRRLPWWMEDRRDPQYREEEKFEDQIRLEAEMRLQQYRCNELFMRLMKGGLDMESSRVIAEAVWEIRMNYWTLHYTQNKTSWDRFIKGF